MRIDGDDALFQGGVHHDAIDDGNQEMQARVPYLAEAAEPLYDHLMLLMVDANAADCQGDNRQCQYPNNDVHSGLLEVISVTHCRSSIVVCVFLETATYLLNRPFHLKRDTIRRVCLSPAQHSRYIPQRKTFKNKGSKCRIGIQTHTNALGLAVPAIASFRSRTGKRDGHDS